MHQGAGQHSYAAQQKREARTADLCAALGIYQAAKPLGNVYMVARLKAHGLKIWLLADLPKHHAVVLAPLGHIGRGRVGQRMHGRDVRILGRFGLPSQLLFFGAHLAGLLAVGGFFSLGHLRKVGTRAVRILLRADVFQRLQRLSAYRIFFQSCLHRARLARPFSATGRPFRLIVA